MDGSNEDEHHKLHGILQWSDVFHKFIDSTGHNQDTQYIFGVTIILLRRSLLLPPCFALMCMYVFFVGDQKSYP
jgi:hypothetical protein